MKVTGRPRQFDEDQALERALELFSQRGYAATSMADLVEHTGVSKQSLYNTFGDKRSLFLAALDRYCERSDAGLAGELARAEVDACALRGLYRRLAKAVSGADKSSCLVAATSMEVGKSDCEISARVRAHLDQTRSRFEAAIERCVASGDLKRVKSPRAVASHLTNTLNGLGVLRGGGATEEELDEVVDVALSVLE
jgi:TetR/AcrR family transcriptional repressor of nem operon